MKIGTGYCYRTPLLPFNFNSIFLSFSSWLSLERMIESEWLEMRLYVYVQWHTGRNRPRYESRTNTLITRMHTANTFFVRFDFLLNSLKFFGRRCVFFILLWSTFNTQSIDTFREISFRRYFLFFFCKFVCDFLIFRIRLLKTVTESYLRCWSFFIRLQTNQLWSLKLTKLMLKKQFHFNFGWYAQFFLFARK